jgi:hypothetical protein
VESNPGVEKRSKIILIMNIFLMSQSKLIDQDFIKGEVFEQSVSVNQIKIIECVTTKKYNPIRYTNIIFESSGFGNSLKDVRYTGIFKWISNFDTREKDDDIWNKEDYFISVKEGYIEVSRKLRLRGGMIDEKQFEMEQTQDLDFDFSFMDNFMIGEEFVMEEIVQVNFQKARNDGDIIKFIQKKEEMTGNI